MELKILSNNENKLLKRKEISFSVVQDGGTVNKAELSKELCKKLNLHPESTIITRIDQGYGMKGSTGIAHAYQTKEMLEKYEPRKSHLKGQQRRLQKRSRPRQRPRRKPSRLHGREKGTKEEEHNRIQAGKAVPEMLFQDG